MASFRSAAKASHANRPARTENGMKARASTANPLVDLFYQVGASRGKDITTLFAAAFQYDRDKAIRIAQWVRDVRGGAGERQLYRDILAWVAQNDADAARALIRKTPEVGRYDDLLIFDDPALRQHAFAEIKKALDAGNGLAAKWMPRKGPMAAALRSYLEMSPKRYRKTLVNLTKVVEQQMCAKQWDEINFSHVPSVAAARYRKAFYKNTPKFAAYVEELKKDPKDRAEGVKVNASSIFPHDVIKGKFYTGYSPTVNSLSATESDFIRQQWAALPDFIGNANILPLVDVSGSMTSQISPGLRAIDVSVALGLYCADKNKGQFKDTFLTFSGSPQLLVLEGDILSKIDQMVKSTWAMNTNIKAAFDKILQTAILHHVPAHEMPEMLLILSDMQFDQCVVHDDSAIEMVRRKYVEAGYEVPKVVFWNLCARHDNSPVKFDEHGTALVSGFSPAILKSLLSNKLESFTPENIMLETIMKPRYDW